MQGEGCGRGQEDSPAVPTEANGFLRGQQWPQEGVWEGAPPVRAPSPSGLQE